MMAFTGIDVVLEQKLETDRIRQGVAAALAVEFGRVSVIEDVADYPERDAASVVCVVTPTSGEFADVVSIQCESLKLPFTDALAVAEQLSSTLETRLLVPADDPNPYLMWLVQPDLSRRQVFMDEAAFEHDRYEIRDIDGV